jgi:hypothetical protein
LEPSRTEIDRKYFREFFNEERTDSHREALQQPICVVSILLGDFP